MTNAFYSASGAPTAQSRGASSSVRAEFATVQAAFDKLPDPVALQVSSANYAVDTGSVNAFFVTLNALVVSYADGMEVAFKALATSTGPATINVNGIGITPVVQPDGSALPSGAIVSGQIVTLRYNATTGAFQYSDSASASAASASANALIAANAAAAAAASAALINTTWQTKSAPYTAVQGDRLMVNTTAGAVSITLPAAPVAGVSQVLFKDYAGTFATNNLTILRNGNNIEGIAQDMTVSQNYRSFGLLFIDATRGWVTI